MHTSANERDEYFDAYFAEFCRSLARHYGPASDPVGEELRALLPHLIASNAELRSYLLRRHPGVSDLARLLEGFIRSEEELEQIAC